MQLETLDSWIGSVNAFTVCAISPIAGILYDRGYLYVPLSSPDPHANPIKLSYAHRRIVTPVIQPLYALTRPTR